MIRWARWGVDFAETVQFRADSCIGWSEGAGAREAASGGRSDLLAADGRSSEGGDEDDGRPFDSRRWLRIEHGRPPLAGMVGFGGDVVCRLMRLRRSSFECPVPPVR
jgi:hypothetical protein